MAGEDHGLRGFAVAAEQGEELGDAAFGQGVDVNEPAMLQNEAFAKVKLSLADFEQLEKDERMRFLVEELDRAYGATKQGGIFWRITPMVNWHLTDNLRIEFAYGYGTLTRFGTSGITQFIQSRIQFQL